MVISTFRGDNQTMREREKREAAQIYWKNWGNIDICVFYEERETVEDCACRKGVEGLANLYFNIKSQ